MACGVVAAALTLWQLWRLRQHWDDATAGPVSVVSGLLMLAVPVGLQLHWLGLSAVTAVGGPLGVVLIGAVLILKRPRRWGPVCARDAGLSAEIALALGLVPLLTLLAVGVTWGSRLPALAAVGLPAPNWLGDYDWAKPAIMINTPIKKAGKILIVISGSMDNGTMINTVIGRINENPCLKTLLI